jgi:hypothetical protein
MAQQEAEPNPSAALTADLIAVLVVIFLTTDLSARTRRDVRNTVAISPSRNSWFDCGAQKYTRDDNVVKPSRAFFAPFDYN